LLLLSIENCSGPGRPLAGPPPEPAIAMVDVHKWYGDLHVLKEVRLKLKIPLIH
jgi:hypothetical protein